MPPKISEPKNLNAQLVDALGKRIVQGHYKEGEQLPIEAELCAEFGVSRPIMREATKILFAKGLLASRPRVGTLVKEKVHWNLLDRDVLTWATQEMPAEAYLDMMFEARMGIEPCAAELAARNATTEDIDKIRRAYIDMAAAPTLADSLEPDIRFHQAIMDASHNDVIRYIGRTLHNALAISIQLTSWHADIHAASLPRHEAIYRAIEARDASAASSAAQALLRKSRRDFDAKT